VSSFEESSTPPVRGFLHCPDVPTADALVLAHGAGSNCNAPVLVAVATAFAGAGFTVLRCDLPYRQMRPYGPPFPAEAAGDRQGLRNAVEALKARANAGSPSATYRQPFERIFLGGHSYGGRQATMLVSEDQDFAAGIAGLLLLSYPLHPPRKPEQLRTAHFPALHPPALFIQGTRDPFGSIEETEAAIKLIPGRTKLVSVEGTGHDLSQGGKRSRAIDRYGALPGTVVSAFRAFHGIGA